MPRYRAKAIVVAEWEERNSQYIINPARPICLVDCKCQGCFQRALNNLLTLSEKTTNDSGTN